MDITDIFSFDYFVNELQELSFRIEDFLLHTYTGFFVAVMIRIKKIFRWIKTHGIPRGLIMFFRQKLRALYIKCKMFF